MPKIFYVFIFSEASYRALIGASRLSISVERVFKYLG